MKKFLTGILVSTMVLVAMSVSVAVEVEGNPYIGASVVQSATLSSGSCGENANYTFDEATGTLTISGSGAMEDSSNGQANWYSSIMFNVSSIIVEEGITQIGEWVFQNFQSLTTVTLSDSVINIGAWAFGGCHYLETVNFTNSLTQIDTGAFYLCSRLTTVNYQGNLENKALINFSTENGRLENANWVYVNQSENTTPQQTPEISTENEPSRTAYIVKAGDTLKSIAGVFHTTVEAIKEANNLDSDSVTVNQTLSVPTNTIYLTTPTYSTWATSHIEKAQESDLIVDSLGKDYTSNITRSQIADLLVNMVEKYTGTTLTSADSSTFTDTSDTAILKANQAGIISGMGDGTFAPDSTATREQIAMMIYKTILVMEEATDSEIVTKNTTLGQYNDSSDVSDWALEAVAILANNGIMEGIGDGNLSPLATASIEQGIILNNALFDLNPHKMTQ